MQYVVNASEVANLCGLNERFNPPEKTAQAVVARGFTKKLVTSMEVRLTADLTLRGKASFVRDDLPVHVVNRRDKLTKRLWDPNQVTCWALAVLYQKPTCRFIESCGNETFCIDVMFEYDKWAQVVLTMQECIQAHIQEIAPPSARPYFVAKRKIKDEGCQGADYDEDQL